LSGALSKDTHLTAVNFADAHAVDCLAAGSAPVFGIRLQSKPIMKPPAKPACNMESSGVRIVPVDRKISTFLVQPLK